MPSNGRSLATPMSVRGPQFRSNCRQTFKAFRIFFPTMDSFPRFRIPAEAFRGVGHRGPSRAMFTTVAIRRCSCWRHRWNEAQKFRSWKEKHACEMDSRVTNILNNYGIIIIPKYLNEYRFLRYLYSITIVVSDKRVVSAELYLAVKCI